MATLDISRLTPKERLDLIGELWDSLSATDVRLTPAQEAELDRRLATFDADRREAIPWEDIEAELDRRSR
ncbi:MULTISPECIES: addiction module protein [unclassified Bradyrhizobium]|uniref:addiction module protein n=1 Tax=unclassified Bradyrhizobium TaxID=2631580 RepID=UPI0023068189|nr:MULTISPECIES: addiction module protein [unclassified Bradyrhizobium]MDA9409051.1 addiction module component, tigr02574 family protein [Bradyrhizobium sp. CCBAU 45384]MDA9442172.1 addiction module component, tigr02574 family protein [Bradyrhizobium sp. CCBAU 51745]